MIQWLVNEGGYLISWWLLVTLAGAAALPLCLRLLGGLPDRGYTLARAAGMLLTAFIFWLLVTFGFLQNTAGSVVLAWLLLLALSITLYTQKPIDLSAWWRENRKLIIISEILFALLFLSWCIYRAHNNHLTGTEKPMELMFMNSVARSSSFPPNDAWMSGYAISYYYFGYVMTAMLSLLSGLTATTAFNLMIALLFALTGVGAFGVVYNLVRSRAFTPQNLPRANNQNVALITATLGMIFVVLLGNFQLPIIEIPYQLNSVPDEYLQFWNTQERETVNSGLMGLEGRLDPATWGDWWWFRSARVLSDYDLSGNAVGAPPIDEFPQFSFLLADLHPHVLALPFVMLALGMALQIVLIKRHMTVYEAIFYAVCIGGLSFLNTWDGPVYLFVLLGAEALRRLINKGHLRPRDWLSIAQIGVVIFVASIALYMPFWYGFRSQASGFLPNIINPTHTPQLFIMFAPFLLLIPPFLWVEARRAQHRMNWRLAILSPLAIIGALIAIVVVFAAIASSSPNMQATILHYIESAGGWDVVLPIVIQRRIATILTPIILLTLIGLVMGRLFPRKQQEDTSSAAYPSATGFALLIVGAAAVLVLVPEFIYLRDNFGLRMNTIFKFYYQAWVMFSIAAAYGVYTVLLEAPSQENPAPVSTLIRIPYSAVFTVVLVLGLLYPVFGVYSRAFVEGGRAHFPQTLTLDGGESFINMDDYYAIMCLNDRVADDSAVVVEAVGGAYQSAYGRVGALTGIPTLLGWENHERQWRGATYPEIAGSRAEHIKYLYQSMYWDEVQPIIDLYGIDYIFFGSTERRDYGAHGAEKFYENLEVVCEVGGSRFYQVTNIARSIR